MIQKVCGLRGVSNCLVLPMATGMCLTLALLALREYDQIDENILESISKGKNQREGTIRKAP